MLGAIIGDIVGSRFEFRNTDKYDFGPLFTKDCDFTDDTICTVAIAEAAIDYQTFDYKAHLLKWCRRYPNPMGSYGASFSAWIRSADPQPYNSFGNGAAMRVSPVAWAWNKPCDVISAAIETANVSHNHAEGIKGAVATALAVYYLRTTKKREALDVVESMYYDVDARYQRGKFDETCQGTVPVALRIVRDSTSFEDAIRLAMDWGGDSDTLGAIVGSMAEALYGIPDKIKNNAMSYLPNEMKDVVKTFYKMYVR